jgi:hypothetical protein
MPASATTITVAARPLLTAPSTTFVSSASS